MVQDGIVFDEKSSVESGFSFHIPDLSEILKVEKMLLALALDHSVCFKSSTSGTT